MSVILTLSFSAACGSEDEALDINASRGPYALVFRGSTADTTHLYAASGDDWTVRQLPAAFDDIDPVWSPNFEYVADADSGGVVLRADGTDRHRLDAPFGPPFSWSPDGNELVYAHDEDSIDDEDGTIFIVSADGSRTRSIARGWLVGTWAGDGRIYFQRGQTIATTSLDAVDPRSGKVETITRSEADWLIGGTWSSDGRRVAYTRGAEDGLFVFEIGAADQPRVLVEAPIDAYSWSPDGQRLAVVAGSRDPSAPNTPGPGLVGVRWELHLVDLEDETSLRVLDVDAHALSWSPNGEWIALTRYYGFDSERNGVSDVWLVRQDGAGLRRLTKGAPAATSFGGATWVPESVVAKAEAAR